MRIKTIIGQLLAIGLIITSTLAATPCPLMAEGNSDNAENSQEMISSKSAILMEASTGKIIYKKNENEKLSPASITKIMTLILIFDAIDEGKIKLTDEVTTSAYAKSMGGSQVFLEEGETQTVETLIKCIVVASGNDASVSMAEHIYGSEEEFVKRMNERAKSLGMKNTQFRDCCGLTDSDEHYTTAEDVAIMSRELIVKYPQIHKYSTIWMENIVHNTKKGSSEFTLANTNKILKQFQWATGLKTGSTSKAKYCVSATAKKNDIELIAVIMAAPDYKIRFKEAVSLLNYGYSNCKKYTDKVKNNYQIKVDNGVKEKIICSMQNDFSYIYTDENEGKNIKSEIVADKLTAPINKGQKVGEIKYMSDKKMIGKIDIISNETVEQCTYGYYLLKSLGKMAISVVQ